MKVNCPYTICAWFETGDKLLAEGIDSEAVFCAIKRLIISNAHQKGFPQKVSFLVTRKQEFVEIFILFDFFAFCAKHDMLFEVSLTSTYTGTSLPQMSYVEFTCGGKRLDRKHVSDLLDISHSSFDTESCICAFPRYWRGIFGEQKVDNVSDFIRVIVEKWLKKEKELYYLSQTVDGFSAEVFFSLEGMANFCFSFPPNLLHSLAKTKTSIRLFVREIE